MVLGALGVALPLLPSVPFLLVAAFAFAESSERCHAWLVNHRLFGALINDWRRYGAIDRRAKCLAVVSMLAAIGLSVALQVHAWVLGIQVVVITVAALYVVSRPSPPQT